VVPLPAAPRVFVFANEYEPGRGHVIIYNWGKARSVPVDLSAFVPRDAAFKIYAAKAPFGIPVAWDRYNGPVTFPIGEEEFGAYLVTTSAPARNGN
jgi:hypothetical protein